VSSSVATFRRFPLAIIAAIVNTQFFILLVHASYRLGGDAVTVCYDTLARRLSVSCSKDPTLNFEMDSVLRSLLGKANGGSYNTMKQNDMTVYAANGTLLCKLVLQSIHGNKNGAVYSISGFEGDIYIGRKNR